MVRSVLILDGVIFTDFPPRQSILDRSIGASYTGVYEPLGLGCKSLLDWGVGAS